MDKALFERLYKAAREARLNSYCPISHFRVGAAICTATGHIYAGTNVEEAAFNATIHAEQSAIAQMVAREGHQKITGLVVVGGEAGKDTICAPCGHCRQLLAEFTGPDTHIIACGPDGDIRLETDMGTLLPYSFSLNDLPSS